MMQRNDFAVNRLHFAVKQLLVKQLCSKRLVSAILPGKKKKILSVVCNSSVIIISVSAQLDLVSHN